MAAAGRRIKIDYEGEWEGCHDCLHKAASAARNTRRGGHVVAAGRARRGSLASCRMTTKDPLTANRRRAEMEGERRWGVGGGGTHRQIGNQPGRQEDGRGANREGEANALSSGPLGIAQHLPVYTHVPVLEGVPPGWSLASGGDAETGEREGSERGSDARGLEGMQVGKSGRGGEGEGGRGGEGEFRGQFRLTFPCKRCNGKRRAVPLWSDADADECPLLRRVSAPKDIDTTQRPSAKKADRRESSRHSAGGRGRAKKCDGKVQTRSTRRLQRPEPTAVAPFGE